MGERRAYVVGVGELRALLTGTGLPGTGQRARVLALAATVLEPAAPPPRPLGPIFTRVPGTPPVRDDAPAPADLDRLLAGGPVPPDRVLPTWRLVEAVAAALAVAASRTRTDRPSGLRPLGVGVPDLDDLTTGWLDRPGAPDGRQLVVFWSARTG